MSFAKPSSTPARNLFPGISGRYVHADRLTLGEVDLAAGAVVAAHQHLHEQVTYVLSGRIEFAIGDEIRVLETGDAALIPANVPHHCRALMTSRVLDVFTPVRDDYR